MRASIDPNMAQASNSNPRRRGVSVALAGVIAALVAGTALAGSTSSTDLLRFNAGGAARSIGDYVTRDSAVAPAGLDTYHSFFIEVPPATGQLVIDIFDADFGIGGTAEGEVNRDVVFGAANSTTTYSLIDPAGNVITTASTPALQFDTGSGTLPAGSDNAWLNFYTRNNPAAGRWEVRMDPSNSTGDDRNAIAIRAHDGNAGAGGTELNLYAFSYVPLGANASTTTDLTSLFTIYPYVTSGCFVNEKDFDYDSGTALTVGGLPQSMTFANRTGSATTFSQTVANANLSNNDVWVTNAIGTAAPGTGPSGTNSLRDGMGIWTSTVRTNETTGTATNMTVLYLSNDTDATTPPTAQPQANTFRYYFAQDSGARPVKPYLTQQVLWNSGPNPPTVGNTSIFTVRVEMNNPTPQAITFSGTRLVQAYLPNNAQLAYVNPSLTVNQGTIVNNPANNSRNVTVQWNPGVVAAGATAEMAYQIRVTPSAAGTIRITGSGNGTTNGDTLGTRADYVDETGNSTVANPGNGITSFGGLCPLYVATTAPTPTPVTLSYVAATRAGQSLTVDWTTDSEYRHVGFDILGRDAGGQWKKLNGKPITGAKGATAERHDYRATVNAGAEIEAIALEEIAFDGARKRHPEVRVGGHVGERAVDTRIDWAAVRAESANAATIRQSSPRAAATRAEILVASDGLWRVRASDLLAAGVDFGAVPADELALADSTGPVAFRLIGASGASFGANAQIEFYGRARDSLYGKTNVYTLSRDPANARRAVTLIGNALPWPETLDSYRAESKIARDREYSFASPSSDPWFDTALLGYPTQPAQASFNLPIDHVAAGEPPTLTLDVWGGTDFAAIDDDHVVDVALNGASLGAHAFPGLTRQLLSLPVGVAIADGTQQVSLTLPTQQGVDYDLIDVDSVALRYARAFAANAGAIDAAIGPQGDDSVNGDTLFRDSLGDTPQACATGTCAAITVSGASATTSRVFVSAADGSLYHLSDPATAGTGLRVVAPLANDSRLLVQPDVLPVATVRAGADPVDLGVSAIDFLIVAHPDFAGSLDTFVSARQAEGLRVRVVDTASIYARYSRGLADPEAITAALRDAYALGARYALLVGGDTYDYNDNLGLGAQSFVPTRYTTTDEIVRFAPSDTLLGDITGDGRADIAVGRWPVRTQADLSAIIAKTLAYATADHAGTAVFASGGSDADLNFTALSTDLSGNLSAHGWSTSQVNIDGSSADSARTALIDALNQGRAFTNFVGHSSVDRWTFDPLLLGANVDGLLTNASKPTVVAQWGCWSSYFVSPRYNSMAHRFLLDADGGAAAVIGAGNLVGTTQHEIFVQQFLARAADGTARLGDAIDGARRDFAQIYPARRDLILGVNLLGDPTLKLKR